MKKEPLVAHRYAIALLLTSSVLGFVPMGCGDGDAKTAPSQPPKEIQQSNQNMLDHMKSQSKK
jgi:hypothetical protein